MRFSDCSQESRKEGDVVEKEERFWAQRMSERSNKDANWWKKNGVGIDKYLSAEQLFELGVIDDIF